MTVPLFFLWKRDLKGPEPQLVFDDVSKTDRAEAIQIHPVTDEIVNAYLCVGPDRTFASAVLEVCIQHFPKPGEREAA